MGKKAKKKSRASPKLKPSKNTSERSNQSDERVEDAAEAAKERNSCVHFDNSVDLDKVLAKIKSSEAVKCEECREGAHEKRGGRGKGKVGKTKGNASSDPKSESKAMWVCLECGHYACAGVGLPTGAQSHVVRHIRQTRHRLVVQWENPHLRWCFPCKTLLPVEKAEDGESKDVLLDIVKLITERSSNSSADTNDVCLRSGSVTGEIKSEVAAPGGIVSRDGYVVRGLVNLGNTCFFNSIMQNLLSLDRLREYFLNEDASSPVGPLNCSLKKFFVETKPEAGLKSVINPRSFFGSVCSKAPQFRGYQQHDSHELLRCLLDALSTEESSLRKKLSVSDMNDNSVNPTLIDSVFGGEISSTVSCLKCRHSSRIYEPFLDLSLPVPTKKSPSPKPNLVSRAKKTKLPPKRVGKVRSKVDKDAKSVPPNSKPLACSDDSTTSTYVAQGSESNRTVSVSDISVASVSLQTAENIMHEKSDALGDYDSSWMGFVGPGTVEDNNDLDFQGSETNGVNQVAKSPSDIPHPLNEQPCKGVTESLAEETWLDFLGPATKHDEDDLASQSYDASFIAENSLTNNAVNSVQEPNLGHQISSCKNLWEEELPLLVQDSQVLYLPYKEESSSAGDVARGEAEASSFVVGGGQEQLDFDGFGDLFNEPEISGEPVFGPSCRAEVSEAGFMAVSSDSDPNEIDDTDLPVSVDSCLAHFTKPEILSNDNAWNCENCSKNLKIQRLKAKKNTKTAPRTSDKDKKIPTRIESQSSGKLSDGDIRNSCVSSVSLNVNGSSVNERRFGLENGQMDELSNCNEKKSETRIGALSQENNSQSDESDGSEDEEMNSESVTVKRDATKRVLISKAPPVLTVHLKRFSQDARGRLSKLNGHINFQETMDLGPFMDNRHSESEKHIYRLAGVVEHSGTMRGGHYVAYVRSKKTKRNPNKEDCNSVWYHVSDSYVRQVSLEEVLRCDAYILFYERI